ncbi:MAG: glycosyl hydrolase [Dehalococcoidia bacterium]|nr:glycosyl hydrolase [Dehalococcoidia bacterium]
MTTDAHATLQLGLVLGPGPEGWWDSERVSSPQVKIMPDGTYRMWYYGRDATFDRQINLPTGRTGLATSTDGIHWERVRGPLTMGAVLDPSDNPNRFDCAHVGVTDIVEDSGLLWMWFLGGDNELTDMAPFGMPAFKAKGIRMLPGCAISRDGVHWTRLEGPYRGAFLEPGGPDDFDALFCAWPRVVKGYDGMWRMYYHALHPKRGFIVGVATSPDGLRWEKRGPILGPGAPGSFDERGISCRHVILHDGGYLMFYEATNQSGYYCIGLATSDDGLTWRKDDVNPVFCHAPKGSGRWDARAVGTPCVVPMPDGSFRMYYIGANEGGHDELSSRHQIGMAVSDGPNYRVWRRWNEE